MLCGHYQWDSGIANWRMANLRKWTYRFRFSKDRWIGLNFFFARMLEDMLGGHFQWDSGIANLANGESQKMDF